MRRIKKDKFNQESVFIITIINRVEELKKIEIYLSILEEKMSENIDDDTFKRWMLMTDNTLLSDLIYMKENINEGAFSLKTAEDERLLGSGWLKIENITAPTSLEEFKEDTTMYQYTLTAKMFCEIIFNKKIPKGVRSVGKIGFIINN